MNLAVIENKFFQYVNVVECIENQARSRKDFNGIFHNGKDSNEDQVSQLV